MAVSAALYAFRWRVNLSFSTEPGRDFGELSRAVDPDRGGKPRLSSFKLIRFTDSPPAFAFP